MPELIDEAPVAFFLIEVRETSIDLSLLYVFLKLLCIILEGECVSHVSRQLSLLSLA